MNFLSEICFLTHKLSEVAVSKSQQKVIGSLHKNKLIKNYQICHLLDFFQENIRTKDLVFEEKGLKEKKLKATLIYVRWQMN